MGQLTNKTRTNYDLGYHSYTTLLDSTVMSILNYGIGAWGAVSRDNPYRKLDQIQHRAARFYCGVPRSCPLAGLYGDLGWIPGVVRCDLESLRMYNQIIRSEDDRLIKKIFKWDKVNPNPNSWSNNVATICASIEKTQCWESEECINIKYAKEKLMSWYVSAWNAEVESKSKLNIIKT